MPEMKNCVLKKKCWKATKFTEMKSFIDNVSKRPIPSKKCCQYNRYNLVRNNFVMFLFCVIDGNV